jgi:signal transduction histidine kinase
MLVDAELSSEQRQRLAGNIYRASRRIQELLQELLDVSRAKNKPVEICSVEDVVASACDALARTAELQSVAIKIEIPKDIHVVVSRERLERVFLNLINNAIDAMPAGGNIAISGREQDAAAHVVIEDTGRGIPAEAWSTLFEPFASFGKKNGLGLGLALSRQTLLDHGGDLWAERITSGARFLLRLPLAPQPPAAPQPEPACVAPATDQSA